MDVFIVNFEHISYLFVVFPLVFVYCFKWVFIAYKRAYYRKSPCNGIERYVAEIFACTNFTYESTVLERMKELDFLMQVKTMSVTI